MKSQPNQFLLLLCFFCIASRLLTNINYIEDPDSLRFALAVLDYDLSKMQPHFPAYPVYIFFVKIFYAIFQRFSIAFSVVGGLATFGIIWIFTSMLNQFKTISPISSPTLLRSIFAFLICFNPLIWLMSNRYMPDLLGVFIVLIIFKEFYKGVKEKNINNIFITQFLIGLLFGVRVSYLPIIVLPAFVLFFSFPKKGLQLLFGSLGILIWLIPLLIDTGGWNNLVQIAQEHLSGHFNDFGGTIQTESNLGNRFRKLIEHGWADGLGGYWTGRHFSTIFISFGLLIGLSKGLFLWFQQNKNTIWWTLTLSFVLYVLWIFFYQNIVFKSRHHLVLLPFLLVLISWGWENMLSNSKYKKIGLVCLGIVFLANSFLSINLVRQHQKPVAIAQLNNHLLQTIQPSDVLITSELVQFYLSRQGINAIYKDINDPSLNVTTLQANHQNIYVIANFKKYKGQELKTEKIFFHNPYVNRMWSVVVLSKF